jgi:hypothetical protein
MYVPVYRYTCTGCMPCKVNHKLRARMRTTLADLIRRHDDLQVNALMNTLCLADGTVWSEASRLIRKLPQRAAGLGIPSAADIADAAFTGATLLIPELLGSLLGATVEVPAPEVRDYLGRWEVECSNNSLRTPTVGEHPARRTAIGSSSFPWRRAAAWSAAWEIAAADKRFGAHWSSVRADRVGCAGFVGDVGTWQCHNTHYPDDDVGREYRAGLARYLCLPLCETASSAADAGRPRWTPMGTTRWSVPRAAAR